MVKLKTAKTFTASRFKKLGVELETTKNPKRAAKLKMLLNAHINHVDEASNKLMLKLGYVKTEGNLWQPKAEYEADKKATAEVERQWQEKVPVKLQKERERLYRLIGRLYRAKETSTIKQARVQAYKDLDVVESKIFKLLGEK